MTTHISDQVVAPDPSAPAEELLCELFAAQVARTPTAVAVVFEDASLSYAELDARANRLARLGLAARVRAGVEPPAVLSYLDPADEVIDTGVTFAERILRGWYGAWDQRPDRYIHAHRI